MRPERWERGEDASPQQRRRLLGAPRVGGALSPPFPPVRLIGRNVSNLAGTPFPSLARPARGQSRGGAADKTSGFYFRERERRAGNAERLLFFSQCALLLLLSSHLPLTGASEALLVAPGSKQHASGPPRLHSAERAAAVPQQGPPRQGETLL